MPFAYCTMAPGAGQAREAARVLAVQAPVLHDEPLQALARELLLVEAHHGPGAVGEVDGVVVDPDVRADVVADVVPLHAGHLAGLAADALRDVDELRDLERSAAPAGGADVEAERRVTSSDWSAMVRLLS